jgi:hypothetical protein
MLKRYKDLMRTLVIELRHILVGTVDSDGAITRGDLDRELERLGIAPDGSIAPFDALINPTPGERQAYRVAVTQLEACEKAQRPAVRVEIVERAAYSWINRLLALRAMETRGLIEETLRNNPDYDGIPESLYILRQTDPGRAAGADGGRWAVLEDACAAQAAALPGLFDLNDPATALRPGTPALIRCMTLVGGTMAGFTLAESDAAFADPDAIGWAYQFYQEETKAAIYAKLGRGGKVATRSEIAAATQLFTEPYMVRWLLQNSLGRSYHEIYPDSMLPAAWEYYVKPDQLDTSTTFTLASLTVLDPCMGSGHFLREAFDMLVAMYREQFPTLSATEIADRILSRHLYGIDIDPRAAQLSALTLYLRAWELVRDERRRERKPGPGTYTPPAMNLATTPTSLTEGALQRHLRRHPQDMPMKPLLEGIFAGLEQADMLGSLLRPKEYLDNAIAELQRPHTMRLDFDLAEAELRRTITEMANRDPAGLRQMLLDRIAESFKAEAGNTDDVSAALFGREAEQGVRLLQLLDRLYAVVVTNPPYMGSKNMETLLKKYVEKYYPAGKRDLYAAFILRCLELCRPGGRVAMVTQHNWMFLRNFVDLRAISDQQLESYRKNKWFAGLLRDTIIEVLAQLGPNAFEEIKGEVVQSVMLVLLNGIPNSQQRIVAFRLLGLKSAREKAQVLSLPPSLREKFSYNVVQTKLLKLPQSPICYWLTDHMIKLLQGHIVGDEYSCQNGVTTYNNNRFLRKFWETKSFSVGILNYVKGGGYKKWAGLEHEVLLWGLNGERLKAYIDMTYPYLKGNYGWALKENTFYKQGWCWTLMAQGALGVRKLDGSTIFDSVCPAVFGDVIKPGVGILLNCRATSYLLRTLSSDVKYRESYVARVPLPLNLPLNIGEIETAAVTLKSWLVTFNPIERKFDALQLINNDVIVTLIHVQSILHALEAFAEFLGFTAFDLDSFERETVLNETGIPAGWFPLIAGYDALPLLPAELDLPPLPQELFDYFETHERIDPNEKELARIKANLRALYEAGPGAKNVEQEETDETTGDDVDEEEIASGAHVPVPTETFLEELSIKMQLHPISVYWLLEELRAEGVRCKPEEQRLLEDRLSVLVLRLLGHRWPKQIEAGEPVPDWADRNGILPLVPGTGKATLAEQVRVRLRAEDGELGVQRTEALLVELTNMSLEEWLRKRFFPRHVSQFKSRPIAWHLASTPANNGKKRRGGAQRGPAFECLLYYHACAGDALARIRTQYVEPLMRAERQRMEDASLLTDETVAMLAYDRIRELEAFVERLRLVEEQGFACPELDKIIAAEPLDRWSGDGYLPPASRDELLRNEQAWHVDINDGVRVNIAPLQLAGVLAGDVLKAADAKKALADRARWRADERRWVRDGKLPRCGWMDEQVPESPRWTEREPERVAEQIRLEQKRLALEHKQAEEVEL